jgi:hypothetical protein
VVGPGEQVEVLTGREPSPKIEVDLVGLAQSSDCLRDGDFRFAAVARDRRLFQFAMLDEIPGMDIPAMGLQAVAAGPMMMLTDTSPGGVGAAGCIPGTGCNPNDLVVPLGTNLPIDSSGDSVGEGEPP